MKKEDFNAWLDRKVEFQTKITIGAVVATSCLGLLGFLLQGGLLFLLLQWGYGGPVAFLAVTGIFGGMGFFVYLTAPNQLRDATHEVRISSRRIVVNIAPTMSSAWTFGFGSMDSDQSIFERIFAMLMIVPRMFWTSWYVYQRVDDVRQIDVAECGKVLRMVLKKAERVDVTEIAEKFTKMDIPRTLRQVSLIDGVVFLTKGSVGISLANRFKDDLEKGLSDENAVSDGNSSLFDGT